ncbi:hypothetical protein TIFTF001_001223, partial [Ficus carica]
MDSYEASRTVFSRIQSLEPENASKIMGYFLIQDYGEKEMIRLAFGPETLLQNLILKAKTHLGILPKSLPISRPNPFPSPPLSYASVLNRTSSSSTSLYTPTTDLVEDFSPTAAAAAYEDLQQSYAVPGGGLYFGSSSEDVSSAAGLGFKPCLYYARGFCKNGNTCRFFHGDSPAESCNEIEQCQEFLRLKAAQSQFIAGASSFPNDGVNPSARQIYLTFPADSTFREEDVSNYFSMYGPVQDVRIPYQQKRMFGFVTFLYPETVKLILAKGNPHFVCDSRVLVKPYKEKGKVVEKKQLQQQQQQLENGDYPLCSSPSGLDYDLNHGSRMFYNNTQEMLLIKKLEERANFQQAIELHGRRLMNLQLMDLKNQHSHRHGQFHRSLSSGSTIRSPNALPYSPNSQVLVHETERYVPDENNGGSIATISQNAGLDDKQHSVSKEIRGIDKELAKTEESDFGESSIEHILPDSLFASPKKAAADHTTIFSAASTEEPGEMTNTALLSTSTLNIASPKSVFPKCSGTCDGRASVGI